MSRNARELELENKAKVEVGIQSSWRRSIDVVLYFVREAVAAAAHSMSVAHVVSS